MARLRLVATSVILFVLTAVSVHLVSRETSDRGTNGSADPGIFTAISATSLQELRPETILHVPPQSDRVSTSPPVIDAVPLIAYPQQHLAEQHVAARPQKHDQTLALTHRYPKACKLPNIPSLAVHEACEAEESMGVPCSDTGMSHTASAMVMTIRTVIPGRSFAVRALGGWAKTASSSLGVISGGLFELGGGLAWVDSPDVFATCKPEHSAFWSWLGFSPSHSKFRIVDCNGEDLFRVRLLPPARSVLQCSVWESASQRGARGALAVAEVLDRRGSVLYSVEPHPRSPSPCRDYGARNLHGGPAQTVALAVLDAERRVAAALTQDSAGPGWVVRVPEGEGEAVPVDPRLALLLPATLSVGSGAWAVESGRAFETPLHPAAGTWHGADVGHSGSGLLYGMVVTALLASLAVALTMCCLESSPMGGSRARAASRGDGGDQVARREDEESEEGEDEEEEDGEEDGGGGEEREAGEAGGGAGGGGAPPDFYAPRRMVWTQSLGREPENVNLDVLI